VFKGFVKLCARLGLYGKELAAIDGSNFKANNSKDRNWTEGKLRERTERLEKKIVEYLAKMEEADLEETGADKRGATDSDGGGKASRNTRLRR
jgi:hypothetical protein